MDPFEETIIRWVQAGVIPPWLADHAFRIARAYPPWWRPIERWRYGQSRRIMFRWAGLE